MQTSAPPGRPAPPHAKIDDATDLGAAFGNFDEEPVARAREPTPEPVAEIAVPVDETEIPASVKEQINQITEANYRREYVDPIEQQHKHLVKGIAEHLKPWAKGVDIERDFVQVLLRLGADEKEFHEQYVEHQISAMHTSNILKDKMRGYAGEFFATKQRREEADQAGWRETQRQAMEEAELKARKNVNLINRLITEPEFSQLHKLRQLAGVGDPWARSQLEKLDAFWMPRSQGYATQGYQTADAIRQAWRDLLKAHQIKLSPAEPQQAPAPKKAAPEKSKPKPIGSLEERLSKGLTDSFERNLSREQASTRGGYFK